MGLTQHDLAVSCSLTNMLHLLQAKDPADSLAFLGWVGLALVAAAFLRPVLRTSAFVVLGLILFLRYNVVSCRAGPSSAPLPSSRWTAPCSSATLGCELPCWSRPAEPCAC